MGLIRLQNNLSPEGRAGVSSLETLGKDWMKLRRIPSRTATSWLGKTEQETFPHMSLLCFLPKNPLLLNLQPIFLQLFTDCHSLSLCSFKSCNAAPSLDTMITVLCSWSTTTKQVNPRLFVCRDRTFHIFKYFMFNTAQLFEEAYKLNGL